MIQAPRPLHNPSWVAVGGSVWFPIPIIGVAENPAPNLWLGDPNIDKGTPHLHWIMGKVQHIMGSRDRYFPTVSKGSL